MYWQRAPAQCENSPDNGGGDDARFDGAACTEQESVVQESFGGEAMVPSSKRGWIKSLGNLSSLFVPGIERVVPDASSGGVRPGSDPYAPTAAG